MLGFRGKDYHFSIEEREDFYNDLTKRLPVSYVLLKTCDRVELYYEDKSIKDEGLLNHIKHLFGLASGIESPIIGECHIINQ
ncbi:MAG: hypothetical protein NC824_03095, partial [Candidatus Omnitrophica bacterium]|nr:hypothetical protein [Candidatus Omnitrophota bacterium]